MTSKNSKRFLIVFDDQVLEQTWNFPVGPKLDFFPLTGNEISVNSLINKAKSECKSEVNRLDSAELINQQVDVIRESLPKLCKAMADTKIFGSSVEDLFKLKNLPLSAWLMSSLSERNPLKTPIFLQLAQLLAIESLLAKPDPRYCGVFFAVADKKISASLAKLTKKYGISSQMVGLQQKKISIAKKLKLLIRGHHLIMAIIWWLWMLLRGIISRYELGRPTAHDIGSKSNLFVSYFPACEEEAEKCGRFENKYAPYLQGYMKEIAWNPAWILMYVPIYGNNFKSALKKAVKFKRNREVLWLTDQFLSIRGAFQALLNWFKIVRISHKVWHHLPSITFYGSIFNEVHEDFLEELWLDSFVGLTAMDGIIHLETWASIVKHASSSARCLYYCEMQSWELALVASFKRSRPNVQTLGFSHTTIPLNYWPYHHGKEELSSNCGKLNDEAGLPTPDVLLAGGEIQVEHFIRSGFPRVELVESIRYLYLAREESIQIESSGHILVVGSLDQKETLSILSMIYAAFPDGGPLEIICKGHPSMPLEEIFSELGMPTVGGGFKISSISIGKLLPEAKIVIVGGSTVSLEALAAGSHVIVPIFPDAIQLSPLLGQLCRYIKVSNVENLRLAIKECISKQVKENNLFVQKYWSLDKKLPAWRKILNE